MGSLLQEDFLLPCFISQRFFQFNGLISQDRMKCSVKRWPIKKSSKFRSWVFIQAKGEVFYDFCSVFLTAGICQQYVTYISFTVIQNIIQIIKLNAFSAHFYLHSTQQVQQQAIIRNSSEIHTNQSIIKKNLEENVYKFRFLIEKVIINMQFKMNLSTIHSILANESIQKQEKKRINYVPGQNTGKWADQQHLRYVIFLDFNKQLMRSKEKRSSNRFFQDMSHFIQTRNALQCRSHHQKLEQKYLHYTKIIRRFKKTFNRSTYKQSMAELQKIYAEKPQQAIKTRTIVQSIVNNNNIEIQTDLCGLQKGFFVLKPQEVKIEESESLPNTIIQHSNILHRPNIIYNYYPQYYQPFFNPYYSLTPYHNQLYCHPEISPKSTFY